MTQEPLLARIESLLRPVLEHMGFGIVLTRLGDIKGRRTLQLFAEKLDGSRAGIDDYAQVSRMVAATLDVEDVLPGAYHLEVSSPGIDRPLTRPQDFERYKNQEAKIELTFPLDGRRRFRGLLQGMEHNDILIQVDGQDYRLPFDQLQSAKLVLSETLLKQTKPERAA